MSRHPPRRVSLLVRNLPMDARSDELRALFERFGEVRDVYLPRDYYTDRPRGFGFVEFRDPRDAEDALYHVDRNIFGGREISVVMSKESRKSPKEMMAPESPVGGGRYRSRSPRRRSRSRSPRRRRNAREYSRSRSPRRMDDRSNGRGRRSRTKSRSKSTSPYRRKDKSRSKSPDRHRNRSPREDSSPYRRPPSNEKKRGYSRSP
ncbi:hypothetical protein BSKO_03272 [Bryopsis sp. KO-2023]|nr:hypothetical protein BSKO_03272 [Bryopsis sp. KO-2023]